MTIEERAKRYATRNYLNSDGDIVATFIDEEKYRDVLLVANTIKQEMIDKAVGWLKENTITNVHDGEPSCGTYYYTQDEFLAYFRNAMEE